MGRIGIMGGTFDPIHIGHLLLAQYAMEEKGLDEIWFIPTGFSYMKEGRKIVPPLERFRMTYLAVEDNDRMRCLDTEVMRAGRTYSYETLEELGRKYPEHLFYFIFGADCLFTIENWKYPERIFASAHIIAAVRGDADMDAMEQKAAELVHQYHGEIELLPFLNLELSSTDIRRRVGEGKSIRHMVPDSVLKYIKEKGFYQNEERFEENTDGNEKKSGQQTL